MANEIQMTRSEFFKRLPRFFFGVGNDLTTALIKNVPVKTSALKQSISFRIIDNRILEITMLDYALHVEFGTPPHIIRPKDKKALHWGGSGGPVVKVVHHPGTRPQPFIRNTFKAELPGIIKNNLMRVYVNG